MNTADKGMWIAAAVASLFAVTGCDSETAETSEGNGETQQELVKCEGINECKGQSDCAGASNDCAGLNDCKGTGYLEVSADECAEKGGKEIEG